MFSFCLNPVSLEGLDFELSAKSRVVDFGFSLGCGEVQIPKT
jgi:hypothetical protein